MNYDNGIFYTDYDFLAIDPKFNRVIGRGSKRSELTKLFPGAYIVTGDGWNLFLFSQKGSENKDGK